MTPQRRWIGPLVAVPSVILSAVLLLAAQSSQTVDLTGYWQDDLGARYTVKQLGNTLHWVGDAQPAFMNVFDGVVTKESVIGEWIDVPGGRTDTHGMMRLCIDTPNRLVKLLSDGYASSIFTRVGTAVTTGPGHCIVPNRANQQTTTSPNPGPARPSGTPGGVAASAAAVPGCTNPNGSPGCRVTGGDLDFTPTSNPALCKPQCDSNPSCAAWTVERLTPANPREPYVCRLFSSMARIRRDDCCTAGWKSSGSGTATASNAPSNTPTGRTGSTASSPAPSAPTSLSLTPNTPTDGVTLNAQNLRYYGRGSYQECNTDCQRDPNCRGWSWVKPGAFRPGDGPVCYLASRVDSVVRSPCCFAGIKIAGSTAPAAVSPAPLPAATPRPAPAPTSPAVAPTQPSGCDLAQAKAQGAIGTWRWLAGSPGETVTLGGAAVFSQGDLAFSSGARGQWRNYSGNPDGSVNLQFETTGGFSGQEPLIILSADRLTMRDARGTVVAQRVCGTPTQANGCDLAQAKTQGPLGSWRWLLGANGEVMTLGGQAGYAQGDLSYSSGVRGQWRNVSGNPDGSTNMQLETTGGFTGKEPLVNLSADRLTIKDSSGRVIAQRICGPGGRP